MKYKITTQKGVMAQEMEIGRPLWAGEKYKELSEKRLSSLHPKKMISVAKGTSSIPAEKYPKSKKILLPQKTRIVVGRGTGFSFI